MILDMEPPALRERVSDWSGLREALAQVVDAVNVNTVATIAVAGGKPGPMRQVTRPSTAIDRVKRERRIAEHRAVVAAVLGR